MGTINSEFSGFETIKKQFDALSQKLEDQKILNEALMQRVISQNLSNIERWYRARLKVIVVIPVLIVLFVLMKFHWGYIILVALLSVFEFLLNLKCYQLLGPQTFMSLDMATASERVARHRSMKVLKNRLMIVPIIGLIFWTILIACNYRWNIPVIVLGGVSMFAAYLWDRKMERFNRKELEELESAIEQLKRKE